MALGEQKIRFQTKDFLLSVSNSVDRKVWNESRYSAFIDELCGDREYQKDAIKTALRYTEAGFDENLRALAYRCYSTSDKLQACYGSWPALERRLQFPDQLSASLDLATGTGKSYVLYGLAAILLAEGSIDRVLVLCPSTTIETELRRKFIKLATDPHLRSLMPADARWEAPRIISADESIVHGCICIENFHSILEHVGSSIRASLIGSGERTLVLNDEAHHVVNESTAKMKKWKQFIADPNFGFRKVIGLSGTCYVGDEYFSDVIFRYSLKEAMADRFVKKVEYIAEMPHEADPDDRWQHIINRHLSIKDRLEKSSKNIRPLTIVVTATISKCQAVLEELREVLQSRAGLSLDETYERAIAIYTGSDDLPLLAGLDADVSRVEWVVSVSMLTEGWDVKRVFQIVPHEERAFNSRLLVAQVLGRGLRVPDGWIGPQAEVTVFNHDAWANDIRAIVSEILEREQRLSIIVMKDSEFNFDLEQIDYRITSSAITKAPDHDGELFPRGFVDLATDLPVENRVIEFERAESGKRYGWQSQITQKTYTASEIADLLYGKLLQSDELFDDGDQLSKITQERVLSIVEASLERVAVTQVTDRMKQKFLQALGTLRNRDTQVVRFSNENEQHRLISTVNRPSERVSLSELRGTKTLFYSDNSREALSPDERETFDEIVDDVGAGWRIVRIANSFDFRTPLSMCLVESENERRFVRELYRPENQVHIKSWIKSTTGRFYEIDYAVQRGGSSRRAKFSPDFFIRTTDRVIVVEIKDDKDIKEASEENIAKNAFAIRHFDRINAHLEKLGSSCRYKFHFLTPVNYAAFLSSLRAGDIDHFRSELDVALTG